MNQTDDLKTATRRYRKAQEALEQARQELNQAMRTAADQGMTPSEIARQTGLTREWVSIAIGRRADPRRRSQD
jgi:DNA-binding phage protein